MRYLISWIAKTHDFEKGTPNVNEAGPTYSYHKHFYDVDKHFILYASEKEEVMALTLRTAIIKKFKDREIAVFNMHVNDVINFNEIKQKVEKWLLSLGDHDFDFFISPGTPAMQTAWYFIHMGLNLRTTLYQSRDAIFTKDKEKPERIKIEIEQSPIPISATILENEMDLPGKNKAKENYKITKSIKPVYELARKIAHTDDITTLILGQTGTGKEYLANYIHLNSTRAKNKFETINCSAMGDQLLESRLFGHKKGSFTDAKEDKRGIFEEANGGTVFLDEIGDISPFMQQSLLRVLQQKEIQPIGGTTRKVDVRIICATNRDLIKMCKEDKFRWDLYYRISITELRLPTLLERGKEEIKEMITYFNKALAIKFKRKSPLEIDSKVMNLLLTYHFPGNIRQLENLLSRLYVYNEGEVQFKDIPDEIKVNEDKSPLTIDFVEKELINKVLKIKKGNQLQTQQTIGYGSINTLKKKMKEYKINPDDYS